jgi:mono/diheme cytochrome c family protein
MHALKLIGKLASMTAIVLAISAFVVAQDTAQQTPPTVKHVPVTNAPSNSGKAMFQNYCAVCHGNDAKGDGPAASALKTPPPDLTMLAQKNGGKYPSAHVASILRGQASPPSHGTQEMPVWGPLFTSLSQGNEGQVQQRIANLVGYVGTLQAK